ncbi:hypothetical protein [Nocardia sp. NPDC057227]|uniref:hypothetical protein n=1 Tax=Nocardia sp. NPDC057227 TaxID=3346056 RepID=UPI003638EF35
MTRSAGNNSLVSSEYLATIIGSFISVIAGIVSYLAGVPADTSFIASLVGVGLSLQAEILVRNAKFRQAFADIGEITSTALRYPEHAMNVVKILRSIDHLADVSARDRVPNTIADPVFRARAERILGKCRDDLESLARGTFRATQYELTILIDAISRSARYVKAVSIQDVDQLSYQLLGNHQDYLAAQKDAADRGVRVERIFVHARRDAQLLQIMRDQESAGFAVYEVDINTVPSNLRVDCAIVDSLFYVRIENGPTGVVVGNRYSKNDTELATRVSEFEELKSIARRFSAGNES